MCFWAEPLSSTYWSWSSDLWSNWLGWMLWKDFCMPGCLDTALDGDRKFKRVEKNECKVKKTCTHLALEPESGKGWIQTFPSFSFQCKAQMLLYPSFTIVLFCSLRIGDSIWGSQWREWVRLRRWVVVAGTLLKVQDNTVKEESCWDRDNGVSDTWELEVVSKGC